MAVRFGMIDDSSEPRVKADVRIRFDTVGFWVDYSSGRISEDARQFTARYKTMFEAYEQATSLCKRFGLHTSEIRVAPGRYLN